MTVAQDSVNLSNELENESSSFHTIKKRLKDQLYRLQVEERALRTLLACGTTNGTNMHGTETFFSEVGESDGSNLDLMDIEKVDRNDINKKELQDLTPIKLVKENNLSNGETESVEEIED
ncbi:hypothetical protein LOD99_11575 [Oopsacas minuta]|uniref:Uncharacterized protein n=1 Tax=Oopsacas minuta TaxID=111878 RepID=A0AAV7JKI4_9METZ|nr:hypothetical protein LOD99_11575 [Oopsacas minuta]